jgi:hypothetical protein
MNKYKDSHFKFLITMIRNIAVFRNLPSHLVKNIIYNLKERKF